MKIKKLFLITIIYFLSLNNLFSIEPDIFVQSTVNRASSILSDDISKDEKIEKLETELENFGYSSTYVEKKNTENFGTVWYTYRDKQKLVKYKESKINEKDKSKLSLLIKKWELLEIEKQSEIKNNE